MNINKSKVCIAILLIISFLYISNIEENFSVKSSPNIPKYSIHCINLKKDMIRWNFMEKQFAILDLKVKPKVLPL